MEEEKIKIVDRGWNILLQASNHCSVLINLHLNGIYLYQFLQAKKETLLSERRTKDAIFGDVLVLQK
ncbi:MAG: hypothetical protein CVT94_05855 [Bacteroidetes bacterium HGW-Bacteroidetes-11]|nr:MAG: hypothetical protein CVT94_05855 [Bacteroidetes bacterium HGW-Bacteroidetes-11]